MTFDINEVSFESLNEYFTQVNVSTVFLINKKLIEVKKLVPVFVLLF